jgi:hypothetical protein
MYIKSKKCLKKIKIKKTHVFIYYFLLHLTRQLLNEKKRGDTYIIFILNYLKKRRFFLVF